MYLCKNETEANSQLCDILYKIIIGHVPDHVYDIFEDSIMKYLNSDATKIKPEYANDMDVCMELYNKYLEGQHIDYHYTYDIREIK